MPGIRLAGPEYYAILGSAALKGTVPGPLCTGSPVFSDFQSFRRQVFEIARLRSQSTLNSSEEFCLYPE